MPLFLVRKRIIFSLDLTIFILLTETDLKKVSSAVLKLVFKYELALCILM